MTWPSFLLTTNGVVSVSSAFEAFSCDPRPTQAHFGPQPPSEVENTHSSPRKNWKASEFPGEIKARQSLASGPGAAGSAAETDANGRMTSAATALSIKQRIRRRPEGRCVEACIPFITNSNQCFKTLLLQGNVKLQSRKVRR